ncbi:MAG TPA: hypothetical protein GXZ60_07305 [Intrasporangiaceae bacterium]|nr:hypothetical protein [Intrasporangiaceae bacterium]
MSGSGDFEDIGFEGTGSEDTGFQDAEFEAGVEQAWRGFRARLADRLAGLQRGQVICVSAHPPGSGMTRAPHVRIRLVRNRLVANIPVEEEWWCGPRWDGLVDYLQDSWWEAPVEDARARWQQVSWHLKTSRGYADWLAVQVVEVLRDGFGVVHPALLGVPAHVWDTTAPVGGSDRMGEEFAPLPDAQRDLAHPVTHRAELETLMLATLAGVFGHPPRQDEDGDVPVASERNVSWVRVDDTSPSIHVFCWPVVRIGNDEAARTEVRILSRRYPFVSFVQEEDRIFARATVLAQPFVPRHLTDLLASFTSLMDRICIDLAERVQGQRGDERAPGERVDEGDLG